jgi:hypothetical protein
MKCEGGGRRGSALVVVLLALVLLSAIGASMVLLSTTDTLAAANQRDARGVLYAAESAIELAADELVHLADWNAVLEGTVRSARVDGPPSGARQLPDGRSVLLEELPNLAGCGRPTPCSPAQLATPSDERPWGVNNPRWRLFAHRLEAAGPPAFPVYTVVLVGDDPMEQDGDPERDGAPGSPGADVLVLRADAFGPSGSRRTVQAVVERIRAPSGAVAPRFLTWFPVG